MNITLRNSIQENRLKIIAVEKDVVEMKKIHETSISEIKLFVKESMNYLKTFNEKDHDRIFSKLEDLAVKLEGVKTGLEAYIEFNKN